MAKAAERRLARPASVVLSETPGGWGVLYHGGTGAAVDLNPVGLVVWKLIDGQRSVDEIAAELGKRFEGVPASAIDDVAAFTSHLAQRGFVTICPERVPRPEG